MLPRSSLALALLLAAPAAADGARVTADAFEAMAQGRTLHFTLDGIPFGSEHYFPGRRSIWRFEDGTCLEGAWWAERDLICFRYQDDTTAQCWRFADAGGGFAATLVEGDAETGLTLEMSGADAAPLPCPGPDVGS